MHYDTHIDRDLNPATVTAILGPTNTGKTHYAVERMLGRATGVIGLPLRLLAREVYDKIVAQTSPAQVALMTGEEKIVPKHARYFVCTVEAMPVEREFAFLAVDEVQLMEHPERGHVFTDRVLHTRGTEETLLLGSDTARSLIHHLLGKEVRFERRERFSTLSHAGPMRLTRLPKRSVIVAFSASEVYAIAELIRRYRGGAAVVMGGLSPRTRNAQAELYQSGEVDFLVATDAVGMGLNLDCDHVAFASLRKFDGRRKRWLTHMEAAQIAGRAGRFRRHGTFGTTADAPTMDEVMVDSITTHRFETIGRAEWRNSDLDFTSVEALRDSLYAKPPLRRLKRVKPASDELALDRMIAIPEVAEHIGAATTASERAKRVKALWDICQIPDFRDLTIDAHVRMLGDIHDVMLANRGRIPHDFLQRRIAFLDGNPEELRLMGVDALSARLARIRTWTYCANTPAWMFDPGHWQTATRAVEDRLSDALHDSLIARFVDRRTSALMKGMGANAAMTASIKDNGDVWVDDHLIGQLDGLKFTPAETTGELEAKALTAAATKAVAPEIDRRLTSMSGAQHAVFTLSDEGDILWGGKTVGRISPSGSVFNPGADIVGGEYGNPQLVAMASERMRQYLHAEVSDKLVPLIALKALADAPSTGDNAAKPAVKGFAFQMGEHFGSLPRERFSRDIRDLDRDARSDLWAVGTVFGQYDVFLREMVKPKPAKLLSLLVAYGAGGDRKPYIPFAGMTSIPDPDGSIATSHSTDAIRRAGYRACGPRIVRFDILERLARMIRQAQQEDGKGRGPQSFQIMQEMLALLGCTYEEVQGVLNSLGYKSEVREPAPKIETAPEAQVEAPPSEVPGLDPGPPTSDNTLATEQTPTTDGGPGSSPGTVSGAEPVAAKAVTPTPAPKRRKGAPPSELHVFNNRETLPDGTTVEHPNHEHWIWGRQPHNRRKPGGAPSHRKTDAKHKGNRDRKPRGKGGNRGGSNRGGGKPDYTPKKDQRRTEDSPFAALAGLNLKKDDS